MHEERIPTPVPTEDNNFDVNQAAYYAYLDEISRYKLLTPDEEISLFMRIQGGDDVARDLFIKSNLRLVVKQAKKYYVPGYNQLLDLIQEGNIGLLKAVDMYDPLRGCKFGTCAVYYINKAILGAPCRSGLPLEVPQPKVALINKIRFVIDGWEAEHGRKPTLHEIASQVRISIEQIRELVPLFSPAVSLHSKIQEGVDDRELIDVFDEHYSNDSDDLENSCIIKETRAEFRRIILELLGEKEAYILMSRWGFAGYPEKDVPTLARELGMTFQGIRQSEARSKMKIKRHLLSMDKSLEDFI